MTDNVAEAFYRLAVLGNAQGVVLNKLPGCWEVQLDKQWRVAVNGHKEAIKESGGREVPPYHAYVEYNGWPAGFLNPRGGTIAAGSCANEDAFIEAINRCVAKLHGGKGGE